MPLQHMWSCAAAVQRWHVVSLKAAVARRTCVSISSFWLLTLTSDLCSGRLLIYVRGRFCQCAPKLECESECRGF